MLAFVAAAGGEISGGKMVSEQLACEPVAVLAAAGLIIGGSVITYMANMEAPGAGPLKKDVELLNGRAAMIGIASLLAVEAVKGVALL
jgi:hypothetical protein